MNSICKIYHIFLQKENMESSFEESESESDVSEEEIYSDTEEEPKIVYTNADLFIRASFYLFNGSSDKVKDHCSHPSTYFESMTELDISDLFFRVCNMKSWSWHNPPTDEKTKLEFDRKQQLQMIEMIVENGFNPMKPILRISQYKCDFTYKVKTTESMEYPILFLTDLDDHIIEDDIAFAKLFEMIFSKYNDDPLFYYIKQNGKNTKSTMLIELTDRHLNINCIRVMCTYLENIASESVAGAIKAKEYISFDDYKCLFNMFFSHSDEKWFINEFKRLHKLVDYCNPMCHFDDQDLDPADTFFRYAITGLNTELTKHMLECGFRELLPDKMPRAERIYQRGNSPLEFDSGAQQMTPVMYITWRVVKDKYWSSHRNISNPKETGQTDDRESETKNDNEHITAYVDGVCEIFDLLKVINDVYLNPKLKYTCGLTLEEMAHLSSEPRIMAYFPEPDLTEKFHKEKIGFGPNLYVVWDLVNATNDADADPILRNCTPYDLIVLFVYFLEKYNMSIDDKVKQNHSTPSILTLKMKMICKWLRAHGLKGSDVYLTETNGNIVERLIGEDLDELEDKFEVIDCDLEEERYKDLVDANRRMISRWRAEND